MLMNTLMQRYRGGGGPGGFVAYIFPIKDKISPENHLNSKHFLVVIELVFIKYLLTSQETGGGRTNLGNIIQEY